MAVGDEGGGEAIFRKLRPQQVRVTRKWTAQSITEMGGESRAGIGSCMNLRRCCIAVSDGDNDPFIGQRRNQRESGIIVRRYRDHADKTIACRLPTFELCRDLLDEHVRDRGRRGDRHSAK